MELLLKKDVGGLGHEGDVVNVKAGYARNYLLPRGLATSVTPQARLEIQAARARREKALQAELERLGTLRSQIEALSLTIVEKASDEGHLFGSVTTKTVLEALAQAGVEVSERALDPELHIKELGIYEVPVQLGPETVATAKVWVVEEI
jgi:large subunit ribosomal protein L9